MKLGKDKYMEVLSDYEVSSFEIKQENDNKIIADVVFKDKLNVDTIAYYKAYDVNKFPQIERVYTILDLLSTKLEGEAKKNKDVFVNLLPKLYGMWRKDNIFIVLEECIVGNSLADCLKDGQFKSFPEFAKLMKQICDAVEMLHKPFPNIVHCDIKEVNILIDENDKVVKIIDFDAAYIEGSGAYNVVRGTKGYCSPELVNSNPVAQSDIYAIGCIMENIVNFYELKKGLDSQSGRKLDDIIEKAKGELKLRYYDVHELKSALSELEILYMLKTQMDLLDDKESFSVYSYDNDYSNKINSVKEKLISYPDADIFYVAESDIDGQMIAFSMTGVYSLIPGNPKNQMDRIGFMSYDELIACVMEKVTNCDNMATMICISKGTNGQWVTNELLLPIDSIELICEILNNIVLYKNSHYSPERIAEYYSNKCREANDILIKKELDQKRHELSFWWDLIIRLGELASFKENQCGKATFSCSEILVKIYSNRERSLRHEIKERPDGYFDDFLIAQVTHCMDREAAYGASDIEERKRIFESRIEEKRQISPVQRNDKKINGIFKNQLK